MILNIISNDTLTLNGNVFNDQADDDVSSITIPNELVRRKTGKNGNTIFAQDQQGFNGDLTLRLMRGSSDDQFMMGVLNAQPSDFPATVLLAGTFVKRLGDGQGNVTSDTYTLSGGVISKTPEGKENVSGDTSQGVTIYNVKFANVIRTIG